HKDAILGIDHFERARGEEIARRTVRIATRDGAGGNKLFVRFVSRPSCGRKGGKRLRVAAEVERVYFTFGLHVRSGIPHAGEIARVELGILRSVSARWLSRRRMVGRVS